MSNKILTNLDLNLNELQNVRIQNLASDPSSGLVGGRLWFRSDTGTFNYYNGSEVKELGAGSSGGESGPGTVKSVALSLPSFFTVSGSPVTSSGTLAATLNSQSANTVLAAPISGGVPTFRKLAESDIPILSLSKISNISATATEINYLTGTNSNIQEQLNNIVSNYINNTQKGKPNGVATLDSTGIIPSSQLPSYIDDVVEAYIVGTTLSSGWLSTTAGGSAFTPESGKIYIIMTQGEYYNKQYRWSGSTYVLCNPSDVNSVNGKTGLVVLTQDDIDDTTTYVRMTPQERDKLANMESGGGLKKYSVANSSIIASNNMWVWNIAASTHGINSNAMIVQVYEVATGAQVFPEITINQSNYQVTIEINDTLNTATLAAGTYRAVIIG